MIGKPSASEVANTVLVVVLPGLLSNPVPWQDTSGAREDLSPSASERGAAA